MNQTQVLNPPPSPPPTPAAAKPPTIPFVVRRIRTLVLCLSALLGLGIYFWVAVKTPASDLRTLKLDEIFALAAITFLYFTLLISPLYAAFPHLPLRALAVKSRRSLGLSAFFFGLVHAYLSFFKLLGGFAGLGFLSWRYITAISLSFTALCILTLLAGTSYDWAVKKLGKSWLRLHRFVYLAGIFIVMHALLLGSHFTNLSGTIPQIFFAALFILVILEAVRFDKLLCLRNPKITVFGPLFIVVVVLVAIGSYIVFLPQATTTSLSIHAQHIKLAQDSLRQSQQLQSTIPGLNGDRTRRFTVSMATTGQLQPNQDVTLQFSVFDAATGSPVSFYTPVYEKLMHLIIVDSSLHYFSHIHPDNNGSTFTITTQFSKASIYHLYLDFQPVGAIEQQIGFTLPIGNPSSESAVQPVDSNLTKTFGQLTVTVAKPDPLQAQLLTLGQQTLQFSVNDSTGQPVTNLQPYLGAFGHLVMINENTYDYIHVHPTVLTPPKPTDTGGPTVSFTPIGIYGPIKPGIYRAFAQFNPAGTLFTADYTVEIK